MKSRKEKHGKRINKKFLTGILLLSITAVSGAGVSFADEDISAKLTSWFDSKGQQSMKIIEEAIMNEKETQKQRLKEELKLEIQDSKEELNTFTKNEIESRTEALKKRTDEIIENLQIDTPAEKAEIESQMNDVVEEAIAEINAIHPSGSIEGDQEKIEEPGEPGSNENSEDIKPEVTGEEVIENEQ
ncbi:hypothetical protein J9317_18675 [Metabacillus sp. KIGAM252]|uniref:DUF5667 domain-containing protein n=1 Tax=Metabacillus flavus TaxID=2823519 RepID=A0ABS5LJ48_9BACI|nr:hypothetical protein [Metabacillus flavus]MBS2970772.1 hypothetical protein [Metabacillus flavus]